VVREGVFEMDELERRRAAHDRDVASRRVRHLTLVAAATATAVTGAIAAVTATSGTVARKAVRQLLDVQTEAATTVPAVPEPAATVPVRSGDSSSSTSSASSPSAPASAPSTAGSSSTPVAVSGGS
jgi:hypothetical protein